MDFFLNLIITWSVGLVLPLLIRFAFARRPLNRKSASWIAFGNSAILWTFFTVSLLIIGERDPSNGFAWVLVFFVARAILSWRQSDIEDNKNVVDDNIVQNNEMEVKHAINSKTLNASYSQGARSSINVAEDISRERGNYLTSEELIFDDLESPVEIVFSTVEVNKEKGSACARVTFRNISEKEVIAIKILIYCYDAFNEPVISNNSNEFEIKIQDLNLIGKVNKLEESLIELLGYEDTRKIKAVVTSVAFSDDTTWSYKDLINKQIEEQKEVSLLVNASKTMNPEPVAKRIDNTMGVYQGDLENGKQNGWGEYTDATGYKYEGEWKNGKRFGKGIHTYPDGRIEYLNTNNSNDESISCPKCGGSIKPSSFKCKHCKSDLS